VSTAKGHGTISSAVDELKITSAPVVLREDGTVLITVCAEMQLQAEGTWKASNSSLISPHCWNICDGFEDSFSSKDLHQSLIALGHTAPRLNFHSFHASGIIQQNPEPEIAIFYFPLTTNLINQDQTCN